MKFHLCYDNILQVLYRIDLTFWTNEILQINTPRMIWCILLHPHIKKIAHMNILIFFIVIHLLSTFVPHTCERGTLTTLHWSLETVKLAVSTVQYSHGPKFCCLLIRIRDVISQGTSQYWDEDIMCVQIRYINPTLLKCVIYILTLGKS